MSQVNINLNTNQVEINTTNNQIVVTDPINPSTVNITQPVTSIVEVITAGPQGSPGPQGIPGPSGSTVNTGSFVTTSSFNAFTSSYNTGSFTGSFTGSLLGTASFAVSSSRAVSSSFAISASFVVSSSRAINANNATTASYALTSSIVQSIASNITNNTSNYLLTATGEDSIQGNSNVTLSNNQTLTINTDADLRQGDSITSRVKVFTVKDGRIVAGRFFINGDQTSYFKSGSTTMIFDKSDVIIYYYAISTATYTNPIDDTTEITLQDNTVNITSALYAVDITHTLDNGQSEQDLPTHPSHAQGHKAQAQAPYSHAEGGSKELDIQGGLTLGEGSHAEGLHTIALGIGQHVQGQFNIPTNQQSAFIIGNGIDTDNRSNLVFASGSQFQVTGSLSATSITGSLLGTASFAVSSSRAISSSFATQALSASWAPTQTINTGSFATTGSNIFIGNQTITGSVTATQGFTGSLFGTASKADQLRISDASSAAYRLTFHQSAPSGYQILASTPSLQYVSDNDVLISPNFSGNFSGDLTGTASYATQASSASFAVSSSRAISSSFATTASFALNALTASFVTGSNVFGPFGSNSIISASFAVSASRATTASYALNGGVTQLLAGPNITLSPTNGLGQVTISSTAGGGGFNTATGSYGSFYDTTTQTNVAGTARSMSLNTTDITNGVSVSGSTNPFNTYIKVENAGVYNIQFSAQIDKSDAGKDEIWIWLRKNGTDLTDTATSIQLTGNADHQVAAWNFFANAAANDYFQLMWYSSDANVRLHAEPAFGIVPGIPSLIVTANRVDQFLSNTGSFSGSFTGQFTGSLFGTASFALNTLTASFVTGSNVFGPFGSNSIASASFAATASYLQNQYNVKITTPTTPVSGTLSETQLLRLEIPPNSFAANDVLNIPSVMVSKVGTAASYSLRVKLSISSSMPTGSTDAIVTVSVGNTNVYTKLSRGYFISDGFLRGLGISNTLTDTVNSTIVLNAKSFDNTVTNYLYVSYQAASTADSYSLTGLQINNL